MNDAWDCIYAGALLAAMVILCAGPYFLAVRKKRKKKATVTVRQLLDAGYTHSDILRGDYPGELYTGPSLRRAPSRRGDCDGGNFEDIWWNHIEVDQHGDMD